MLTMLPTLYDLGKPRLTYMSKTNSDVMQNFPYDVMNNIINDIMKDTAAPYARLFTRC